MPGIDLHTHTYASDGQFRPAEVVRMAARAGLSAVGITDHDTIDGLQEAITAGEAFGIEVIPGCELSVVDSGRQLHILGLWVSPNAPALSEALVGLRESRHHRNRLMVEKLKTEGINIDYDEVMRQAGGTVGRPHIAHILVDRGVVKNYDAAFRVYLGRQGRAFAPKKEMPLGMAVDLLKSEGATVMLAHPYLLGETGKAMEELVRRYQSLGVDGIEAYYTDHSPIRTKEYLDLAKKLDMPVCGGSDFHGKLKPQIRLGAGKGGLFVPESVLEGLKAHRLRRGLWT